jgi:hypothetical protein
MRRLMMAAAITALAGAGSLMTSGAQALPGAGGLQGTADTGLVEKTQVVCPRPFWNGWRWVQPRCRPVYAPPVYAPIGPPVMVVRPWRRPRYYYY